MRDRYASVHLEMEPGGSPAPAARELNPRPFDLLLVGDFSARGTRDDSAPRPEPPPPIRIDRDGFPDVLAQLSPRIRLALAQTDQHVEVVVRELDDLHPDGLYDGAPLFARLRELRRRALDPRELGAVAAELGEGNDSPPPEGATVRPSRPSPAAPEGMLDLILAETTSSQPEPTVEAVLQGNEMPTLIRRLVRPHLVDRPDPRQAEVIAALDAALADAMRALLHHPEFQRVEALWRGTYLLVREIETSATLRIHLLDATSGEVESWLASDVPRLWAAPRDPGAAGPFEPALLVVLRSFSGSDADIDLLRRLAEAGSRVGAPCLAGASAGLAGHPEAPDSGSPGAADGAADRWLDLRRSPSARFLGLAFPGFLLRAPYGSGSDECDRFPFEELGTRPSTAEYLWAEPALACALLLGRAFALEGWDLSPGRHRELHGLPIPLESADGGVVAREATMATLTEREAEAVLDRGIMPLLPIPDRGALRVPRFQSIAEPAAPLAGGWRSA